MVNHFFSVVTQLRTVSPKDLSIWECFNISNYTLVVLVTISNYLLFSNYTLVQFFSAGGRDESPMLQTFETKEVLLPIAEWTSALWAFMFKLLMDSMHVGCSLLPLSITRETAHGFLRLLYSCIDDTMMPEI